MVETRPDPVGLDAQPDLSSMRSNAEESDGFSYAQLREGFIMAGQFVFERGDDITAGDLLEGVRALRTTTAQVKRPKEQAGFRLRQDESA